MSIKATAASWSKQFHPAHGLFAITNDREGHSYQARRQIAVNGTDINDVQLVLHPAASIPVTINHAAAQAPEQPPGNAGLNLSLVPADSSNFQQYGMMWHPDQAVWSVDNIQEGKYKLAVQSFGNECVDSAWYGNVDLLRDYLVVTSAGATNPIIINMRADCSSLNASLAPGTQQSAGFLVVVPTSSSLSEPKILTIAAQGPWPQPRGFPLTLSPGSYQVYAFTTLEDLEYANPEVLREYPSQSITLDPGQKLEFTVKLTEPKGQ